MICDFDVNWQLPRLSYPQCCAEADQPKAETGADLIRHRLIENRGALLKITDRRVERERNKEIYFIGKFLPLATCLLMGELPLSPPRFK
jgi:hypothetical protein